ncbi:MAG: hypothetical protein SGPRY_000159 [Prymnesium sp.]
MKASPWALSEDGRLHTYTLILALCVDSLPSTSLPIFNGGPPPPQGEKVENLQLFKNGGVGALNDMGTQARLVWLLRYSLMGVNMEAAVHAERWSWIVVTRKPGQLRTYVNGRLCADIKLEAGKKEKAKESKEEEQADGANNASVSGPKPQLQEKFVIDPQFLALFSRDDTGKDQSVQGAQHY